ncbi:glycerophosphodiester phosphodiesterase, partial [Candidatus Woesearchaeota archaeon]|nr:glycerophosphodiester phosphodiesterase [Candidatus Woesearchaeota archaeon]
LNIEIKDSKATEEVLNLVEKEDYSQIILSSSKLKVLFDIRKKNKEIKTSLIFWSTKVPFKIKKLFDKASRTEVNAISLSKNLATKSLISKLHEKNLKVYVWTVNKKEVIEKMKERCVDGIFTDDVRLFKE